MHHASRSSRLDNHVHIRRHAIRPFFIRHPQLESKELGLRYCRRYERGFLHSEVQERDPAAAALAGRNLSSFTVAMDATRAPADLRGEEGSSKTSVTKHKPHDLCANKDCHVIRGRIMTLEGESFMVKERSGKEVRMTVDRKTQKGQVGISGRDEEFAVGDTIEAYVTSTGHAESISLMRPSSVGRPEEIGG